MPVQLIATRRFEDARGWFAETWNKMDFRSLGLDVEFVQDNQSLSRHAGTIRGLHFQATPYAQAKLVRCLRGRIFDVAVDIRPESPTFGRWVGAELSAKNGDQLFVPRGFAHGFLTLEDDTEVAYKVDGFYDAASDRGICWNDKALAISWPLDGLTPVLSEKDLRLPPLSEVSTDFAYDGRPLSDLQSRWEGNYE